jgi:glutamate racemase
MVKSHKKCIGFFDSGFGGVNILREVVKKMPNYNYIYLGDTARVPYGTRSKEAVYEFTKQAVDFVFSHDCDLLIFACNTASSYALKKIQREYLPKKYPGKKVLGVLVPSVQEATNKTKNNRVGIIATEGTVGSGVFIREFFKLNPKIKFFQNACPLLVPIVESGEDNHVIADLILEKYLRPILRKNIDTLILGCTHYGILENKIRKIIGSNINIVSGGRVIPKRLSEYLDRHPEIVKNLGKNKKIKFYSTDLTKKFSILGSKFFGKKFKAEKVSLF